MGWVRSVEDEIVVLRQAKQDTTSPAWIAAPRDCCRRYVAIGILRTPVIGYWMSHLTRIDLVFDKGIAPIAWIALREAGALASHAEASDPTCRATRHRAD